MKYEAIEVTAPDEIELLTFKLDSQLYAIEITSVLEIKRQQDIARLPHAPEAMAGVINLRGNILPILHLRSQIGLPLTEETASQMLIVVREEDQSAGLLVDDVCDILTISNSAFQESPETFDDTGPAFLKSIALVDDKMIGVLDMSCILPKSKADRIRTV